MIWENLHNIVLAFIIEIQNHYQGFESLVDEEWRLPPKQLYISIGTLILLIYDLLGVTSHGLLTMSLHLPVAFISVLLAIYASNDCVS